MNIGLLFVFLGMILSVAQANHWFIVPFFIISFCWVVGIFYVFVYGFSKTFAKNVTKEIQKQINISKTDKEKEKLEEIKKVYENID